MSDSVHIFVLSCNAGFDGRTEGSVNCAELIVVEEETLQSGSARKFVVTNSAAHGSLKLALFANFAWNNRLAMNQIQLHGPVHLYQQGWARYFR